jgi:hypothetical protein
VLLWNQRRTASTPFLRDYEQLLITYGTDYQDVRHERTTDVIDSFFAPAPFQSRTLEITQEVDYAALEGRLLSSSYTPPPGHANYDPMLCEVRRIFALHENGGQVSIEYDTLIYWGRLG